MRATFIRHGQSQANIGLACPDFRLIELTPEGHAQAKALAAAWAAEPTLIVHSPFVRTQQTAAPTIRRFPQVPVEIWPVQEFCNLTPARFNGTTYPERAPFVEAFWDRCDPAYIDGHEAESFSQLLARARATLDRLTAFPPSADVLIFSHGFFMNAVRSLLQFSANTHRDLMLQFVPAFRAKPFENGHMLRLTIDDQVIRTVSDGEFLQAARDPSLAALQ